MVSKRMAILVLLLALPLLAFAQEQAGDNQGTQDSAQQGADPGGALDQGAADQTATVNPDDTASGSAAGSLESLGNGLYRISQGVNVPIANRSGDISGTVQDLLIDDNGGIRFLVVSLMQGVAVDTQADQGMDNQGAAENQQTGQAADGSAYLVPIRQVRWEAGESRFTFDLTSDDLGNLKTVQPGGDFSAAAREAAPESVRPAPQRGGENMPNPSDIVVSYLSVRSLIGSTIISDQGTELGQLEDVVINIPQTRVQYLAMSASDRLGLGERYYALPMRTVVGVNAQTDETVVSIPGNELTDNAGFQPGGAWPGDADPVLGLPPERGAAGPQAPSSGTDSGLSSDGEVQSDIGGSAGPR